MEGAYAAFILAQLVWLESGDLLRARELGRLASELYEGAGAAHRPQLAEVRAWLRRLPKAGPAPKR